MKQSAKIRKTANVASVQGYHQGGSWINREAYAFCGFRQNKYFTSDRFIPLDETFRRPDGKPLKGYGLEIETSCYGIENQTVLAEVLDKVVFAHFPRDLFKMQNDSTLGGSSNAECITQVMTKEAIRNNYSNFKLMYDTYFESFDIRCDDGCCGMHVNMSNALFGASEKSQSEAIRKLYYIVNHHYNFMAALVYRDLDHTDWCEQMRCEKDYCKTLNLHRMDGSHGNCFNGSHFDAGRIELRLVGGQKNFACFRNTMESIFWLVERVKKLSWNECDDLVRIFAGCNQYVYDRISTYCKYRRTISDAQVDAIRATVVREDYI